MAGPIEPYAIVLDGEFIEGVTAKAFLNELDKAQQHPVIIYLNSPGGCTGEAHQMLSALDTYPAPIRIHIDGVAASAATFIVCAANAYVSIVPHGLLMIHRCWTETATHNADSLKGDLSSLNKCDLTVLKVLQRRLKLPAAEIETMLSAETWFSSTEALALGLVDAVVRDINEKPKAMALGRFENFAPFTKPTPAEAILEKLRKQINGEPTDSNIETLLKEIRDLLTGTKPNVDDIKAAWYASAGVEFRNTAGGLPLAKPSIAELERTIFQQVSGGYHGR